MRDQDIAHLFVVLTRELEIDCPQKSLRSKTNETFKL